MATLGLGDNSVLIKDGISVDRVDLVANNTADFIAGTDGSTVYVVADGKVGDDTLANFETWDSLVTHKKIYDSNNDGIVWFGGNDVLDIDRTSSKNAGADQLTFTGDVAGVRYLGTKDGLDFVYADALTLLKLEKIVGQNVIEGTVGNDSFDAGTGDNIYLYDNALGLNLGGDTILNFGKGDVLVTTQELFDSDMSQSVTFGRNAVLDLAGGVDPLKTGGDVGAAGQIDFGYTDPASIKAVHYLGEQSFLLYGAGTISTADDVYIKYYFYGGSADTAYPVI